MTQLWAAYLARRFWFSDVSQTGEIGVVHTSKPTETGDGLAMLEAGDDTDAGALGGDLRKSVNRGEE